jgi:hypothetical protein
LDKEDEEEEEEDNDVESEEETNDALSSNQMEEEEKQMKKKKSRKKFGCCSCAEHCPWITGDYTYCGRKDCVTPHYLVYQWYPSTPLSTGTSDIPTLRASMRSRQTTTTTTTSSSTSMKGPSTTEVTSEIRKNVLSLWDMQLEEIERDEEKQEENEEEIGEG